MTQKSKIRRSRERVLLRLQRYRQMGSECALATAASIANYYDPSITYRQVRKMVSKRHKREGLHTPEQALLLNRLGFDQVSIVTFDLEIFDFSWNMLTREGMIRRLEKAHKYLKRRSKDDADMAYQYIKWLRNDRWDNRVLIDNNLTKHIRRHLRRHQPVGASYNYTSFWKASKGSMAGNRDIKGEILYHSVIIRGFDSKGLFIIDSDRRSLSGFYKVSWEDFLINVPSGDLLLVKA
jgi:hypothetical protein